MAAVDIAMKIVGILENYYSWALEYVLKDTAFKKIVEELKSAEAAGALRSKAEETVHKLRRLEPDADNVHVIVLGRLLERLLDQGLL